MTATTATPTDAPPRDSRTPDPATPPADTETRGPTRPSRVGRVWRGPVADPRWVRPALIALLVGTAVLYLWSLAESGWANSFYSAAAQAGSESWKAFFFGSSDASSSITVDKPPASLWVMALSVRLFGLSSWSILAPQALMGVAAVGLVYLAVRRWHGPGAGLLAGLALALTPVAALMFRFNNPDALLVLLMTFAAYATVRAVEKASPRWLIAVGALIGFGFLTKMLQALLVVPAFALVYLVAAPTTLGKRVLHLLSAGAAVLVAAGWWIAIVSLVPAADRPYIGGSQSNSILELTLGYNGFGRLTGNETGSVGGGGGGTGGGWGTTGIGRMFSASIGGQIAWLLPAALAAIVVGLVVAGRAPRTDRARAGYLMWGGWLLVTAGVFSFMAGIFHEYYTVALAPAIAALVGMSAATLWARRSSWWAAIAMGAMVLGTAVWSFALLSRSSAFVPWLRWVVVAGGAVAAVLLVLSPRLFRVDVETGIARTMAIQRTAATLAVVVALAGPAAYTVQTVATAHTGSIVTAGPTVAGARGGFGGGGPGGQGGGTRGGFGGRQGGQPGGTPPGAPTGGPTGGTGNRAGGAGGLLNGSTPGAKITALLEKDAQSYTWVAAAVGSQNASGYQLATEDPVMAIGGFNGSDPSPTLAQFTAYVAAGQIHYFIAGSGMGGGGGGQSSGGSNASAQITAWVEASFTAQTVDGVTVYDLTQAAS